MPLRRAHPRVSRALGESCEGALSRTPPPMVSVPVGVARRRVITQALVISAEPNPGLSVRFKDLPVKAAALLQQEVDRRRRRVRMVCQPHGRAKLPR